MTRILSIYKPWLFCLSWSGFPFSFLFSFFNIFFFKLKKNKPWREKDWDLFYTSFLHPLKFFFCFFLPPPPPPPLTLIYFNIEFALLVIIPLRHWESCLIRHLILTLDCPGHCGGTTARVSQQPLHLPTIKQQPTFERETPWTIYKDIRPHNKALLDPLISDCAIAINLF